MNKPTYEQLEEKIKELQRQLDEQAKQEPVAWQWEAFGSQDGEDDHWFETFDSQRPFVTEHNERFVRNIEPLYALPPNIDAMIERAVREEREAALKPLRTAVLALAHALERDPGYRSAYEEVDAAIRARGEKK